jgi:DedD protein
MEEPLKQRLVGAAVLVGLAVIFVPMLIDERVADQPRIEESNIPPEPTPQAGEFTSRIVPLEPVQPVTPPSVNSAAAEPLDSMPAPSPAAEQPSPTDAVPDVPSAPSEVNDAAPTAAKPVAAGVQAWAVQLGSFASEKNARDLEARLQKQGYAAFVEKLSAADGTKFRVRVGPELDRQKAEAAQQKLDKDQNLKGIVVRYP